MGKMKKLNLLWIVLIGLTLVISSCAKKEEIDDSSDASTDSDASTGCAGSSSLTEATSCSGTPSGTITGIDNMSISGIISPVHSFALLGITDIDNTTDCISGDFLSSISGSYDLPTGAEGLILNKAITSDSTFADRLIWYSDSTCSTEMVYIYLGATEFNVGDNVTGLSTTVSGSSSTFPSTATKVSWKQSCFGMKASTDAGATWLKTFLSGTDPTVGTAYTCTASTATTKYAIMNTGNHSTYGQYVLIEDSESGYPSDWNSDTDKLWAMP